MSRTHPSRDLRRRESPRQRPRRNELRQPATPKTSMWPPSIVDASVTRATYTRHSMDSSHAGTVSAHVLHSSSQGTHLDTVLLGFLCCPRVDLVAQHGHALLRHESLQVLPHLKHLARSNRSARHITGGSTPFRSPSQMDVKDPPISIAARFL